MLNPIELASELIGIESITPNDNGCQDRLNQILTTLGFECTSLPSNGVTNTWAILGNTGPIFAFSGHTDTVPAGPLRQWTSPPFEAHIRDQQLYGRGAADMKSALAAMVCATERFLSFEPKPAFRIGFMFTSDEEGEATDGTVKIVEHIMQQQLPLKWCLIGEATSSKQFGDGIKIGRRGSLHGTLHLKGKQGHIAYPALAENPIHRCFKALDALTQTQWDAGDEHFTPTSFQIYNIHADTGATNMIPGSLTAQFNFRFSPQSSFDSLKKTVTDILDSHQLNYKIDWNLSSVPFYSQPGVLVQACQHAISQHCDITTEPNTKGGTSDGRFVAQTGCEVVELGPLNHCIHQVNEHINIEDLNTLTDIYTNILNQINQHQQGLKNGILADEVRT